MAELAGLSAAANVAQFVVYGIQSAQYLYQAYRQTDDFVKDHSALATLARSIHTSVSDIEDVSGLSEIKIDQELGKILRCTDSLAKDLIEKFEKLEKCLARGDRWARIELAARALWSKSDIEQLLGRLTKLRDEVSHRLVVLSRFVASLFIECGLDYPH